MRHVIAQALTWLLVVLWVALVLVALVMSAVVRGVLWVLSPVGSS